MYWHIGERINREVLGNERTINWNLIIAILSQQLQRHLRKADDGILRADGQGLVSQLAQLFFRSPQLLVAVTEEKIGGGEGNKNKYDALIKQNNDVI